MTFITINNNDQIDEDMSLRKQPFLKFYVRDWIGSTKLKRCSATAHGIMINVMANMHMEETYGVILLEQNTKQNNKQNLTMFERAVNILCKFLTFDREEVEAGLKELVSNRVLYVENESIICHRMVKDNDISEKRANSGALGGATSMELKTEFAQANTKANTKAKKKQKSESESESANEYENEVKEVVSYLNLKAGKDYRFNGANVKFIRARLAEGYTVEQHKKVIDVKCKEWLGGKMEKFLRIATLFIPSHFEDYLNQKDEPITTPKNTTNARQGDDKQYQ